MGSRPITFLWLWPVTDHEPHCWHVSINNIWRWTESTARSGWWRSHMAGIYSDCSTRQLIIIGAYSGKRLDWWSTSAMSMQCSGAWKWHRTSEACWHRAQTINVSYTHASLNHIYIQAYTSLRSTCLLISAIPYQYSHFGIYCVSHIHRVAPKRCTSLNHHVDANKTDFTEMLPKFLEIKIRLQFLCGC